MGYFEVCGVYTCVDDGDLKRTHLPTDPGGWRNGLEERVRMWSGFRLVEGVCLTAWLEKGLSTSIWMGFKAKGFIE